MRREVGSGCSAKNVAHGDILDKAEPQPAREREEREREPYPVAFATLLFRACVVIILLPLARGRADTTTGDATRTATIVVIVIDVVDGVIAAPGTAVVRAVAGGIGIVVVVRPGVGREGRGERCRRTAKARVYGVATGQTVEDLGWWWSGVCGGGAGGRRRGRRTVQMAGRHGEVMSVAVARVVVGRR